MIVLFWDIDGTLLTTGKGGVPAWEQAVHEVTGRVFELASIRTAGLTDYQIAVRSFELLDLPADAATLQRMVGRYESLLPEFLPQRNGYVLPNVRDILDATSGRPDIRSYLLTGNTRGGARAKLTHYSLFHYFADGAFAEDQSDRSTIAVRALALAQRDGPVSGHAVFVIGDTPHDIECAKAIGAKTIAVATGGYSLDELQAHHPWTALRELPPVDEFLRLIGAGSAADAEVPAPDHRRHATSRE